MNKKPRSKQPLVLGRETIMQLTNVQLRGAAGGGTQNCSGFYSCAPNNICHTE